MINMRTARNSWHDVKAIYDNSKIQTILQYNIYHWVFFSFDKWANHAHKKHLPSKVTLDLFRKRIDVKENESLLLTWILLSKLQCDAYSNPQNCSSTLTIFLGTDKIILLLMSIEACIVVLTDFFVEAEYFNGYSSKMKTPRTLKISYTYRRMIWANEHQYKTQHWN